MQIDVRHIAKLSKLKLDEDKIEMFEKQMQAIAEMVEGLPELDDDMKLDEENTMELRPDEVRPSLRRENLFSCAPKMQSGCVVVPKTV